MSEPKEFQTDVASCGGNPLTDPNATPRAPGPVIDPAVVSVEAGGKHRRTSRVPCAACAGLLFSVAAGLFLLAGAVWDWFCGKDVKTGAVVGGVIAIVCSPLLALAFALGFGVLSIVWDKIYYSLAFLLDPVAWAAARWAHAPKTSDGPAAPQAARPTGLGRVTSDPGRLPPPPHVKREDYQP
jgi:hypothetical protein